MSENIDTGMILEALNDKTDRDCRNVDTTSGADVVIEYQIPTAENNYTWYRLYKSGWVEQGGVVPTASGTSGTITFPKAMNDTNYVWMSVLSNDAANNFFVLNWSGSRTTTTIGWVKSANSIYGSWEVRGLAAQS